MINYEIDSLSIPLVDFSKNSDKTYKYLFNNSIHIEMAYKDVLSEFYSKVMENNPECMGDYNILPEYGEASKNYRFRFMIFKVEDDYVLVLYKIVDPRTASIKNYFTVSYPPISLNGKSTDEVVNVLKQYPDIKYIVSFSTEDDFTNNNYYNMIENFREMDKSGWRSKRGVNRLRDIIRFDTRSEDIPMIEEYVTDVTREWNKLKGKTASVRSDLNLIKMARKTDSVRVYSFWYKDKIVGFSIGIDIIGKYLGLITTKTVSVGDDEYLANYLGEDDMDLVRYMRKHIGSYVQYAMHKEILQEMGYKAVYYYGDTRSKTLRIFKMDYFKNRIFYKRVPTREGEVDVND